jgi:predicted metal-dependent phosphoesterase TrpH
MDISEFIKFRKIIKGNKILRTNGHNHTTTSDGRMGIVLLLLLNLLYGFNKIAVTDHNVAAWNERKFWHKFISKIFRILDIEIISGIEFSCFFELNNKKREFHIVGIGIDPDNKEIKEAERNIKAGREEIIKKMLEKIRNLGFSIISFEKLKRKSGGNITLPDIANNVRTKNGKKIDSQKFINEHLEAGKDCYLPNDTFLLSTKEVIRIIKLSGGTAIWAHPKYTLRDLFGENFENIALQLKNYGIDGIETFRGGQNMEDTSRIKVFCKNNELAITGGPDTHKAKDLSIYAETIVNVFEKNKDFLIN